MFIVSQFLRSTMFENFTFNQQVSAVANGKGFIYVMIGNEDADILIF